MLYGNKCYREKNKARKGRGSWWIDAGVTLNKTVREGFTKKIKLTERPKNDEGNSHLDIWRS